MAKISSTDPTVFSLLSSLKSPLSKLAVESSLYAIDNYEYGMTSDEIVSLIRHIAGNNHQVIQQAMAITGPALFDKATKEGVNLEEITKNLWGVADE